MPRRLQVARKSAAGILLMAGIVALVGCGSRIPSTPRHSRATGGAPKNNFQAPASAREQQLVRSILSAVNDANNQLKGYQGTILTTDRQGSRQAIGKATFKYLKPNLTRIDLISNSDQPSQAGTRVFWDGGPNVQVRASGFLGAIKVNIGMDDARLKSLNGYTVAQLHHSAILKLLFDPQAMIKPLGPEMVEGRQAMMLAVAGVSPAPGVDHVKVGIDYASRLPIAFEFYRGDELTYSLHMSGFSTNPPQTSELML